MLPAMVDFLLDFSQADFEIGGLQDAGVTLDNLAQLGSFGWGQFAHRHCRHNRSRCGNRILRLGYRRQFKLRWPIAAGRHNTIKAEAERRAVPGLSHLNRLPGQGFSLSI